MLIKPLNDKDMIFDAKNTAVPYSYRTSYRVSLICLIMSKCCGKKGCSSIKLQLINTALGSPRSKEDLMSIIETSRIQESTIIRFDPVIIRAINYAIADHLIYHQANGLYRLDKKGKLLVDSIYSDDSILITEKTFLSELSSQLTEEIVSNLAGMWRLENA